MKTLNLFFVAVVTLSLTYGKADTKSTSPTSAPVRYTYQEAVDGGGGLYSLDFTISGGVMKVHREDMLGDENKEYKILSAAQLQGIAVNSACVGDSTIYAGRLFKHKLFGKRVTDFVGVALKPDANGNAQLCVTTGRALGKDRGIAAWVVSGLQKVN